MSDVVSDVLPVKRKEPLTSFLHGPGASLSVPHSVNDTVAQSLQPKHTDLTHIRHPPSHHAQSQQLLTLFSPKTGRVGVSAATTSSRSQTSAGPARWRPGPARWRPCSALGRRHRRGKNRRVWPTSSGTRLRVPPRSPVPRPFCESQGQGEPGSRQRGPVGLGPDPGWITGRRRGELHWN